MRNCSICNSVNKKKFSHQNFCSMSNKNLSYDLVVCKKCGFVYADNIPDSEEYADYYKNISKYEAVSKEGNIFRLTQNSYKRIAKIVNNIAISKEKSILDIGCATGDLLNILKKEGYKNLSGVEPAFRCKQIAKKLYDLSITTTTLGSFKSKKKYDLLILSHVLEHLGDLPGSLKKVNQLISDNGFLYIEVPAINKIPEKYNEPYGYFSLEHINYFSEISLENLMKIYGFKKIYMKIFDNKNNFYPPFPVITSLWKKSDIDKFIIYDNNVKAQISRYILKSKENMKKIKKVIGSLRRIDMPIIVWGAGSHTLRLYAMTNLAKVSNIVAIVDSNKNLWGKEVNGLKIKSPKHIGESPNAILISSCISQPEINQYIQKYIKSCKKIITFY